MIDNTHEPTTHDPITLTRTEAAYLSLESAAFEPALRRWQQAMSTVAQDKGITAYELATIMSRSADQQEEAKGQETQPKGQETPQPSPQPIPVIP